MAHRDYSLVLPIVSMAFGIPLTAIAIGIEHATPGAAFGLVVVIWAAIVAINIAHSRRRL